MAMISARPYPTCCGRPVGAEHTVRCVHAVLTIVSPRRVIDVLPDGVFLRIGMTNPPHIMSHLGLPLLAWRASRRCVPNRS